MYLFVYFLVAAATVFSRSISARTFAGSALHAE
jgi:hypothetical protein